MKTTYYAAGLGCFTLGLLLAACDPEDTSARQPSVAAQQAQKAKEAAESIKFEDNGEIDNIKNRYQQTADPGKLGFIILLNAAGQPIVYEGVKGKITSSGKRLTPPDRVVTTTNGNGGTNMAVRSAASEEGTYGSSSPYIFYWNTDGVYRQWSGDYLYSDQPIRLRVEPLVIAVQKSTAGN